MRDQPLARLLTTLDAVPNGPGVIPVEAAGDFAEAAQRLRAAQRQLGSAVQEGPYLAFARRLVVSPETIAIGRDAPFAASA